MLSNERIYAFYDNTKFETLVCGKTVCCHISENCLNNAVENTAKY
jgi:hypothetical protein